MDLRKEVFYYDAFVDFPTSGQENRLYLSKADGSLYYWDGLAYQLAGDGTALVNSVTASAPLASSGGANPNITITQATGSVNGFLSSTDWTTFNNKLSQAYTTVEDEGTPLTQRSTINFVGSGVTAADSGGKTVVTIASGSSSGRFGIADSNGAYTYYTTLQAAITAASAGQTVEMFTDYTETGAVTITLKDGVNINGNGHTYTHSYAAGNSDTFQNISGAISCVISNLRVIRSGRANGTTGDFVLNATVNDSQFFFDGVYMESTYGNAVNLLGTTWQYKPHSGNLYAKAYLTAILTQGSIDGFIGQSTTSGSGIGAIGGFINRCTGISISGAGIGAPNAANSYGYTQSGIALSAGNFYNCFGVSTTHRAADGNFYSNCTLVSTSGNGATNGTYRNCTIISSSGWGAYHYLNNFDNCHIYSATNIASGGGFRASFRGCTVLSEWNNAGGHGFDIGADTIINNCNITVSNTGANCIYKGSAVTIKYASNVFAGATTAVNANITQGIVNTEDNQGNILI